MTNTRKKTTSKKPATTSAVKLSAKAKAAEAKLKGQQITTYKELGPVAKEVNTRLEKADKLAQDAFDHRLAAALKLGEAKKRCEKDKVNFKQWCEANVDKSYETVRKLATIGVNPETKARQLLQDLRDRTRASVQKARKNGTADNGNNPKSSRDPVSHAVPVDPVTAALAIIKKLPDSAQREFANTVASLHGLVVVSKEIAQYGRAALSNDPTLDQLKLIVGRAGLGDKRALAEWITRKQVKPSASADPFDIPAVLDRRAKPAKKADGKPTKAAKAKATRAAKALTAKRTRKAA